MKNLDVRQRVGGVVTATSDGRELWQYHHRPVAAGHPCFHPVNTPAGYTISLLSPWDHIHHTALWFGWKFVDGLNSWEGPAYPPYESSIKEEGLTGHADGFTGSYEWLAGDSRMLLKGKATCHCSWLDDSAYAIDLEYEFATPGDLPVTLDRGLPPEAGYAGLSVRVIREFRHGAYADADGRSQPPVRGTPVPWHAYSGPIDGGPGRRGGCALMDHPENPRFPAPTYSIHESEAFGFMQYAFLYNDPWVLEPTAPLRLRYRVAVFDGDITQARGQDWFEHYRSVAPSSC